MLAWRLALRALLALLVLWSLWRLSQLGTQGVHEAQGAQPTVPLPDSEREAGEHERLAMLPTYQAGDAVGAFQLVKRIDVLGMREMYPMQHHWKTTNALDAQAQKPTETSSAERVDNEAVVFRDEARGKCLRGFCLRDNIFHGGHGDVWKAKRKGAEEGSFVLKRMRSSTHTNIGACALREEYFGTLLHGSPAFPEFVARFEVEGDDWLVFKDEGDSLLSFMYALDSSGRLRPSRIWHGMRTTARGRAWMKDLLRSLIAGVADLHRRGIVHRDLKASNLLLNGRIVIADFSSAVHLSADPGRLYDLAGPTVYESTLLYAPPEVLLALPPEYFSGTAASSADQTDPAVPYSLARPESYDIWSVGVVFLELLLGTADVFSVDQRSAALIVQKLQRSRFAAGTAGPELQQLHRKAMLMASLADYCIYSRPLLETDVEDTDVDDLGAEVPAATSAADVARGARRRNNRRSDELSSLGCGIATDSASRKYSMPVCSVREFAQALLRRDPLGKGFPDKWGLDLLRRLLHFDPLQRINMTEALAHAFFRGAYISVHDHSKHATADERDQHDRLVMQGSTSAAPRTTATASVATFATTGMSLMLAEERCVDPATDAFSQLSDGDADTKPSDGTQRSNVDSAVDAMRFMCGHCHRRFVGDWSSCAQHLQSRGHGSHCLYSWNEDDEDGRVHAEVMASAEPQLFAAETAAAAHAVEANAAFLAAAFPACLSQHALLPLDERVGWCDLQGRRSYVEDLHALFFGRGFVFTGVFDGHFGSFAARFSSGEIYASLTRRFVALRGGTLHHPDTGASGPIGRAVLLEANAALIAAAGVDWVDSLLVDGEDATLALATCETANADGSRLALIEYDPAPCVALCAVADQGCAGVPLTAEALRRMLVEAFLDTNAQLLGLATADAEPEPSSPNPGVGSGDEGGRGEYRVHIGGSTASVLMLLPDRLLAVASVGDSRVIACCVLRRRPGTGTLLAEPVQLTVDHTPRSPRERERVQRQGGFVEEGRAQVPRVNGTLAVTRSLGDPRFAQILSAEPDVVLLRLPPWWDSHDGVTVEQQDEADEGSAGAGTAGMGNVCADVLRWRARGQHLATGRLHALFAVVGSDGLWDAVTNEQAAELVCAQLAAAALREATFEAQDQGEVGDDDEARGGLLQGISRLLAHEALLRGSSDNIGVSVIDLSPPRE